LSETAEQRTKRRFIEYLGLTRWTYQYSFFYQNSKEARASALDDATKLKEKLRRTTALKAQPFLYRLCLYRANAFHTIFTTKAIDLELLESIMLKVNTFEVRVIGRTLREEKIENYKRAIKNQRPHNLIDFFGDTKINRIALLNLNAIERIS
jgi:hypothetical protein